MGRVGAQVHDDLLDLGGIGEGHRRFGRDIPPISMVFGKEARSILTLSFTTGAIRVGLSSSSPFRLNERHLVHQVLAPLRGAKNMAR